MFTDSDIYKYLSKKKNLEYQLTEAEYRYASIPSRIKLSVFKLIATLIVMGCALPFTGFCLYHFIKGAMTNAYTFIGMGMGTAFGGIISLALIISLLKTLRSFFGYESYKNERKEAEETIRMILDEISENDEMIDTVRRTSKEYNDRKILSDKIKEKLTDGIDDEKDIEEFSKEFFRYAYGTFGEDADDIRQKYSRNVYDEELADLRERLRVCKEEIRQLGIRRRNIDEDYEKASTARTLYLLFVFLLVFAEYATRGYGDIFYYVSVFGAVFGLGFFIMLEKYIYTPMHLYKLEHQPNTMVNYGVMNNVEPTVVTRQKIAKKMDAINNRLEFVEQIVEVCKLNNYPKLNTEKLDELGKFNDVDSEIEKWKEHYRKTEK